VIKCLPGALGNRLRSFWYWALGLQTNDSTICAGTTIVCPKRVYLGDGSAIGENCYLNADGGTIKIGRSVLFNRDVHLNSSCGGTIEIGDETLIGPGVLMRTAGHRFDDQNALIKRQGHLVGDIRIGSDCWIGARAIVLGGVTIGVGAVVGAGAVVTKDVSPHTVVAGVPARAVRMRGEKRSK